MFLLHFLNIFFFIFHTALTLFNIAGWASKRTRKWHLLTMLLTAASWFILGIWYGWGYCACTDWHWDVRESLGYHDRSNSYIHFLILKLTGRDMDHALVEKGTLVVFLAAALLTVWLNVREWRGRRAKR